MKKTIFMRNYIPQNIKKLDLESFNNFMLGMPTLNEEEALYCERDFT